VLQHQAQRAAFSQAQAGIQKQQRDIQAKMLRGALLSRDPALEALLKRTTSGGRPIKGREAELGVGIQTLLKRGGANGARAYYHLAQMGVPVLSIADGPSIENARKWAKKLYDTGGDILSAKVPNLQVLNAQDRAHIDKLLKDRGVDSSKMSEPEALQALKQTPASYPDRVIQNAIGTTKSYVGIPLAAAHITNDAWNALGAASTGNFGQARRDLEHAHGIEKGVGQGLIDTYKPLLENPVGELHRRLSHGELVSTANDLLLAKGVGGGLAGVTARSGLVGSRAAAFAKGARPDLVLPKTALETPKVGTPEYAAALESVAKGQPTQRISAAENRLASLRNRVTDLHTQARIIEQRQKRLTVQRSKPGGDSAGLRAEARRLTQRKQQLQAAIESARTTNAEAILRQRAEPQVIPAELRAPYRRNLGDRAVQAWNDRRIAGSERASQNAVNRAIQTREARNKSQTYITRDKMVRDAESARRKLSKSEEVAAWAHAQGLTPMQLAENYHQDFLRSGDAFHEAGWLRFQKAAHDVGNTTITPHMQTWMDAARSATAAGEDVMRDPIFGLSSEGMAARATKPQAQVVQGLAEKLSPTQRDNLGTSPNTDPFYKLLPILVDKLMAKDDGWLASLFDALARINGPVKEYLAREALTVGGLVLGGLLILAQGSAVAPFIYTLF
jgi:hypothetical protein